MLLALLAPAGCAPGLDQFAPACPQAGIVPGGGDVTRWRGTGRDITDLALQARIVGIQGQCKQADAKTLGATVSVQMVVNRGPAAPGQVAALTYFVAVAQGDRILDKQVYPLNITFPPNSDHMDIASQPVQLRLPVSDTVSGAAYEVWTGFQLSPQELETNLSATKPQ
jgi:hypothetical protein